ncbi:MAG: ATP-binding protein [Pseudomonadota bacterium]
MENLSFKTLSRLRPRKNGWVSYSTVAVLAAVLFAAITTGLVINSLNKDRRGVLAMAGLRLQGQTGQLAEFSSSVLQSVDMTLVSLAPYLRDLEPGTALKTEDRELIKRRSVFVGSLESIWIIDSQGNLLFRTDARPDGGVNFSNQDFFRRHQEDWVEVQARPLDLDPEKPGWGVSRRFEGRDGRFGGVIVGLISPDYLRFFFSFGEPTALEAAAVVDEKGHILAARPKAPQSAVSLSRWAVEGRNFFQDLPEEVLGRGGSGLLEVTEGLVAFQQLRGFPFRVVAAIGRDRVLAGWWRNNSSSFILAALLILSLTAFILVTGRLLDRRSLAERTLAKAEEAARWSQLLREIALAAGESSGLRDAVKIILREVSLFLGWPLAYARLDYELRRVLVKYEARDATRPDCADEDLEKILAAWTGPEGRRGWTVFNPEEALPLFRAGYDLGFVIPSGGGEAVLAFIPPAGKNLDDQWTDMLTNLAAFLVRVIAGKKAEEALRAGEALLRETQAIAKVGGWEIDLKTGRAAWTDETRRILEADPGFYPDLGTLLDFFQPDDREAIQGAAREAIDSGRPFDLELLLKSARGAQVWGRIAGRPFFKGGRPLRLTGTLQDVTAVKEAELERRALEEKLLQAQKMEAIGTLAGGVAHDFNNVLQSINGYTQLIGYTPDLPPKVYKYVREVEAAVKRAAGFVQRLLAFSRKVEPELEPVNLNEEIAVAASWLEQAFPGNIKIETRLADNLLPVLADKKQIQQVIQNLGANSAHAMPDGGRLALGSQNVFLGSDFSPLGRIKAGRYVLLEVTDTGTGIKKERLDHIFDPFFTTKAVGEGSGMGLSIAYGIVRKHDGYIVCRERSGPGATFEIYFPALVDEAAPNPGPGAGAGDEAA